MHPVWDLPLSASGIVMELPDGGRVRIRPARKSDIGEIKAGFERLSQESRYYRFFSARSQLGDSLATSLTDIDHENHFAWAVFDPDVASEIGGDSGLGVAAARLIRDVNDPTCAEAALTVVDDYHGHGIGRFLIELLVATGVDVGANTLRFEILRTNRPMIGLIASMGATSHPIEGDASVVEYRLTLPSADEIPVAAGALYELLRRLPTPASAPAGDADDGDGDGGVDDGEDEGQCEVDRAR